MGNSLLDEFTLSLNVNAIPSIHSYSKEIFHYTALKNIESILCNSPQKIILWASQYDCLNDISEGTVVEECYKRVCLKLKNDHFISNEMYNLLARIRPSRNDTFIINLDGKLKIERCESISYITSFCKSPDALPLWNYYSKGDLFEGINFGLNPEDISVSLKNSFPHGKILLSLFPVIYKTTEQEAMIKNFLLEINQKYKKGYESSVRAIVSIVLSALKFQFKQEYFEHEQEVRLVVKISEKYKDTLTTKYRTTAGYIIPYVELEINKSALQSVTFGPFHGTFHQRKLQDAVMGNLLISNGYSASISHSKVPVRY